MQRLFATFPDGRPGFALLLLRAAVAGSLLLSAPTVWPERGAYEFCVILACLTILGLFVPYAAAIGIGTAALVSLEYGVRDQVRGLFILLVFSALGLLGAGSYSIDSRLFGRRTVVFQRSEKPKQ